MFWVSDKLHIRSISLHGIETRVYHDGLFELVGGKGMPKANF